MKGAYLLIIFLGQDTKIKYGVNTRFFSKGYYVYVGSGMNNLEKRVERHKSKQKKLHWHIDYLLNHAKIKDVIMLPSKVKRECSIAKKVGGASSGCVQGFGCSDCRCESHLFYFKSVPKLDNFKK